MTDATLNKRNSLKHKKLIENLFATGKSIKNYPVILKYSFRESELEVNYQVGFSVSKRKFKRAVDRNRIKRQMRESFRNNKTMLINSLEASNNKLTLMFIYTGNEILKAEVIDKCILNTLEKLSKIK